MIGNNISCDSVTLMLYTHNSSLTLVMNMQNIYTAYTVPFTFAALVHDSVFLFPHNTNPHHRYV